MEYHKTDGVLLVKQGLGHKRIESTMRYINIEQATLRESDHEFDVKGVASLDDTCKFSDVGFEYITDMEDKKLFRKRKRKPHI
jgi:hypothetical protein